MAWTTYQGQSFPQDLKALSSPAVDVLSVVVVEDGRLARANPQGGDEGDWTRRNDGRRSKGTCNDAMEWSSRVNDSPKPSPRQRLALSDNPIVPFRLLSLSQKKEKKKNVDETLSKITDCYFSVSGILMLLSHKSECGKHITVCFACSTISLSHVALCLHIYHTSLLASGHEKKWNKAIPRSTFADRDGRHVAVTGVVSLDPQDPEDFYI